MPTIYVLSGPEVGKTFSVRAGDTIGRSPDRILTLRHASVSRKHAHLEEEDGVWYVIDDGSQNGVVFQGQRAERAALFDAAEFALGEILLRFRLDVAAVPATSDRGGADEPVEDEIFLGEDDEPEPPRELARTVVTEAPARPPRDRGTPGKPERTETEGGRRILQYHKVDGDRGLAGSDLAQFPPWARALLVLLALALAGGVAYLTYRGTFFVKEQVRSETVD